MGSASPMASAFAGLVDTYPEALPPTPPSGFVPFVWAASAGLRRCIVLMIVFTATIVRETIGAMTEARKGGWNVPFATSAAANVQDVVTLGKEMVDGLYATGLYETPYEDLASPRVKEWIGVHRKMFGGDPNTQTIYGYNAIMNFACFAEMAGRNLNGETLLAALESGKGCTDIFGSKPVSFKKGDHLHMLSAQLHQIKDGRWVVLKKDLPM